jgi:Phosphoinositide phospholipase C, Ca2+-dependent
MTLHDCWDIRLRLASAGLLLIAAWTSASAPAAESAALDNLRLNQLQFIGTHNSYHVRAAANRVPEWNYSHATLDVQLDRGVRSFELDLHDRAGDFEVFHVPLLDEGTTCRRLNDALATVRRWSDAHPRHVPISFLFELKKEGPKLDPRIKQIDSVALDRLDETLRSAFPDQRRITPDDVRGTASTLREAVTTTGWPTLAASRGKVFFILHDNEKQRELYTQGHPSLRGRQMFVRSDTKRDDAGVLILDNPRAAEIPRLVGAGYFVRTRADSDLGADLARDVARRQAAFDSGAQILSTDFPSGEPQPENGYLVEFPGAAPARANPVNAPEALGESPVGE